MLLKTSPPTHELKALEHFQLRVSASAGWFFLNLIINLETRSNNVSWRVSWSGTPVPVWIFFFFFFFNNLRSALVSLQQDVIGFPASRSAAGRSNMVLTEESSWHTNNVFIKNFKLNVVWVGGRGARRTAVLCAPPLSASGIPGIHQSFFKFPRLPPAIGEKPRWLRGGPGSRTVRVTSGFMSSRGQRPASRAFALNLNRAHQRAREPFSKNLEQVSEVWGAAKVPLSKKNKINKNKKNLLCSFRSSWGHLGLLGASLTELEQQKPTRL